MRVLLDTHVLLWALAGDARLGPRARAVLEAEAEVALVSTASLWEATIKAGLGKLIAEPGELATGVTDAGFQWLPVMPAHVVALGRLPARPEHRDPFDRMLVAQAATEGLTLMTADRHLAAYGVTIIGCDT